MQEVYFEINFHLLFYIKTSIGFSCNYSNIVSVKILIFYIFYLYIPYIPLHIFYFLYSTLLIPFVYILIKKKCFILSIIILVSI